MSFAPIGYPARAERKKTITNSRQTDFFVYLVLVFFKNNRFTIIFENTKKGNNSGKILIAQMEIPFKKDFAHNRGLIIIIMQIIIKNNTVILFDFKNLIIYNSIAK